MRVLVSSAKGANGAGYGAIVAFDLVGNTLGTFCDDGRVADPRGLCVDPSGDLLYANNGTAKTPSRCSMLMAISSCRAWSKIRS